MISKKSIKCIKCGDENNAIAKYCKDCGEDLPKPESVVKPTISPFVCPGCSYDCQTRVNFCQMCNHKFIHPPGSIIKNHFKIFKF